MTRFETIRSQASATYALSVYLPASRFARAAKDLSRTLRRRSQLRARTVLPETAWHEAFPRRPFRLVETGKAFGNVNLSELAVLALASACTRPGTEIVEIGTFDGRTALNFAANAPDDVPILTLDLPPDRPTAFAIDVAERRFVDKPQSGARLHTCTETLKPLAARVTQAFGDSASYDWSPHFGRAGLVFVDGSHAYDYVCADSATAMRLVAPGGMVLWHDYGIWPGVTQGLEELEATRRLGLKHIRGTSLVIWRAAAAAGQAGPDALDVRPTDPAGHHSKGSVT